MNLQNCNLVDIVWVERGIILMMIYFIIKNYNNLEKKKIVINNKKLRNFFNNIFSNLKFVDDYKKNKKDFFYFNIRSIQKNQDIIVDYLKNYDEYVPTKKAWLIPYYDLNDPLIIFKYDKSKKLDADLEREIIKNFTCERGNYQNSNTYWDIYFENSILNKAKSFGLLNIQELINNYFLDSFIDTNVKKSNLTNFIFPVINYTSRNINKQEKSNLVYGVNFDKVEKEIINKPTILEKEEDEKILSENDLEKQGTRKIEKPLIDFKVVDEVESTNRKKMINLMNIIGEKIGNLNNLNKL